MRQAFALLAAMLLSSCDEISRFVDPDNHRARADNNVWASKNEIIKAAEVCGVPDFEPTEAGSAWAAYVPESITDRTIKEQCIYDHFAKVGLLVTR